MYPDLAVKGSAFNQAFVQLYARRKAEDDPELQKPNWPVLLANEVAGSLGVTPAEAPPVAQPSPTPQAKGPNLVQERIGNYVDPLDAPGGDRGVEGSGRLDHPAETKWAVSGTVTQKFGDGVLVRGTARSSGTKKAKSTIYFLYGLPNLATLFKNSPIKDLAMDTGTYKYTDDTGVSKTVAEYKYYAPAPSP